MDNRFREAQRRHKVDASPENARELLRERMRQGEIPTNNVELAASLGDVRSSEIFGRTVEAITEEQFEALLKQLFAHSKQAQIRTEFTILKFAEPILNTEVILVGEELYRRGMDLIENWITNQDEGARGQLIELYEEFYQLYSRYHTSLANHVLSRIFNQLASISYELKSEGKDQDFADDLFDSIDAYFEWYQSHGEQGYTSETNRYEEVGRLLADSLVPWLLNEEEK